jgi:hypothetical protein
MEPASEEIDVAFAQAEHLGLAQSAPHGKDWDGPIRVRVVSDDGADLLRAEWLDLLGDDLRPFTALAAHGLRAINPSSTAAESTVETWPLIVRAVDAPHSRPASHACTVVGRIRPMATSPSFGYTCDLSRDVTASRDDSANLWIATHCSA